MTRALPDPAFWSGRRVLVTGHTGFKGRWLTLWLRALGAEVTGFSRRDGGDVADAAAVHDAVAASRPEVVFHLAGLATVQLGYDDPAAVYTTNVVGLESRTRSHSGADSLPEVSSASLSASSRPSIA